MATASLPKLTYSNLSDLLSRARKTNPFGRKIKTVANNTDVFEMPDSVQSGAVHVGISHHRTTIGEVSEAGFVMVRNGGYGSASTRGRINEILSDNNVPYYVAQRKGVQVLMLRDGSYADNRVVEGFTYAEFVNGELVNY